MFAIGVSDADYCERLTRYLVAERKEHTEVRVFSDPACFREELKTTKFHAALLEEAFLKPEDSANKETRFILMNDGQLPEAWRELPTIYAYQSADNLLREMYALTADLGPEIGIFTGGKELIGVYSPHGHDLQIPFSLGLSEILAEKKKTLYLNFMDCAGFEEQFETLYPMDLGDLLYFVRGDGKRFYSKLSAMTYRFGNVDFLPPVNNPELIHEATRDDYERLLTLLCEKTDYEAIVMDFGSMLPGFGELLKRCDRIYCPVADGAMNGYRLKHFERYLSMDGGELSDRVRYLTLSEREKAEGSLETMKEQLFWGEFGEALKRQIIEENQAYGA